MKLEKKIYKYLFDNSLEETLSYVTSLKNSHQTGEFIRFQMVHNISTKQFFI